jgi:RNA polymerase sigma-70 factor, ECF subfamily
MTPADPTAQPFELALSLAYSQLRRGLLASIRRKVRNPQIAEDLLQDVFVKALRALREGRPPGSLPAWLHQVVRTTVADHYRAGRLEFESLEEEPAAEEPDDVAAFQALATCMEPLAATLPPLYRDALLGADFQGQRLAALADAAGGVSVSAIKSRSSRARAMLRERLLACCEVARDSSGQIESFQAHAAAKCACGPGKR